MNNLSPEMISVIGQVLKRSWARLDELEAFATPALVWVDSENVEKKVWVCIPAMEDVPVEATLSLGLQIGAGGSVQSCGEERRSRQKSLTLQPRPRDQTDRHEHQPMLSVVLYEV